MLVKYFTLWPNDETCPDSVIEHFPGFGLEHPIPSNVTQTELEDFIMSTRLFEYYLCSLNQRRDITIDQILNLANKFYDMFKQFHKKGSSYYSFFKGHDDLLGIGRLALYSKRLARDRAEEWMNISSKNIYDRFKSGMYFKSEASLSPENTEGYQVYMIIRKEVDRLFGDWRSFFKIVEHEEEYKDSCTQNGSSSNSVE